MKIDYRDGAIVVRPVIEEKEELRSLRHEAERKFAEVWKNENDTVWESYLKVSYAAQ